MFEGLFQPMHLIVIFGLALLVFGPKKIPELGKGLGDGLRAVHLELTTGSTQRLLSEVLNGDLEAAFIAGPIANARIEIAPLAEEQAVIVAEAGYRRRSFVARLRPRMQLPEAGRGMVRSLSACTNSHHRALFVSGHSELRCRRNRSRGPSPERAEFLRRQRAR